MRHVAGVWVPSALLQRIAADEWKVGARTHLICNGIAIAAYARGPDVPIPGFERRPGEVVIGTMAGLRKVKDLPRLVRAVRSEEHTSELQSLMRISYAVFCLKNKIRTNTHYTTQKTLN